MEAKIKISQNLQATNNRTNLSIKLKTNFTTQYYSKAVVKKT